MEIFELQFLEIEKKDKERALSFLEDYVQKEPNDFGAKLACALYLQQSPFDDFPSAIKLLDDLLIIEEFCVRAILLKAFLEDRELGQVSDQSLNEINQYLKYTHNKYFNQLFIVKALYYNSKDNDTCISCLKESISMDPKASYNHFLLGKKLQEIGKISEGKEQLEIAIKNVAHVQHSVDFENYNPIDFNEFVEESLRGVNISLPNYEEMVEGLK